jgi:ankyrin repeat protein
MARKKASRKQETTLVPYKASDLSGLLERAKTGISSAAVQAYLHAGGTAMTFVEAPIARGPIQVALPHYMAIMNPHPHQELAKCVQLLVDAGADIDAFATGPISADHTALSSASTRHCCSKVLQVMLQNGADAHKRVRMLDGLSIHLIAFSGCAQNCDALLDSAPDLLEAETTCNTTAIALAASQVHCSVVEALHKRGASLHCRDVQGSTPLHLAASKGHITVMRYLIEHGADVNAVNLKGQPPLNTAASNHTAAAEVLLAHGADANSTDHSGLTALHAAAEGGHIETATVLIAAGADVTIVDNTGSCSLHRAIDNSNADMVKLLL